MLVYEFMSSKLHRVEIGADDGGGSRCNREKQVYMKRIQEIKWGSQADEKWW
jgi:hypothetical protein